MANLTNTASLFKKIIAPISILLLVGALIFLIFFRFTRVPKPILPPIDKPLIDALPPATTSFDSSSLAMPQEIPEILPVYEITNQPDLQSKASVIAQKLGFDQKSNELNDINLGEVLMYSNNNASLSIYRESIFYIASSPATAGVQFQDLSQYQTRGQDFLSSLALPISSLSEPSIKLSKKINNEITTTSNLKEADFINFKYHYLISGIPMVMPTSPISVTLNAQEELIHLSYRSLGEFKTLAEYPVITPREALELLLNSQGALIETKETEETGPLTSLERINVATLQQAYPAYYLPSKTPQVLQPVWVFEGETVIGDETIQLTYAVPAISGKFLANPKP